VQVQVQDEGIGLEAREVETIFERYDGRWDTALQQGIRGHGLGLFICRRIAESHEGSIYTRPLSKGSSFTLVLPLTTLQG
jgi:signal transduction histidine kinase